MAIVIKVCSLSLAIGIGAAMTMPAQEEVPKRIRNLALVSADGSVRPNSGHLETMASSSLHRRATAPDVKPIRAPVLAEEHQVAIRAHCKRIALDPAKIAVVLAAGTSAIQQGIMPFLEDPPNVAAGLEIFGEKIWEIVLTLLPEDKQGKAGEFKARWDEQFASLMEKLPTITAGIQEFRTTGNEKALGDAITDIFEFASGLIAEYLPAAAPYLDAIQDIADGIATSWFLFQEGEATAGVQTIYETIKASVDALVPGAATNKHYQMVLAALDPIIGDLNTIVGEFKERILTSNVCYIKRKTMPRESQSVCPAGYTREGTRHCIPPADRGADCWEPCGKTGGMCEEFCGAGGACCRKDYANSVCECKEATGFSVRAGQKGAANDYHQCVTPGPYRNAPALVELEHTTQRKGEPSCVMTNASVVQPALLEEAVKRKENPGYGSVAAKCDANGLFSRTCDKFCYEPCPTGYVEDGCGCKQPCTGQFSFSGGPLMCSKEPMGVSTWVLETIGLAVAKVGELWAMISQKKEEKEEFSAGDLSQTVRSFIGLSKQLANPICPEGAGSVGTPIPPVPSSVATPELLRGAP
jgi:hypothetical protein